MSSVFNNFLNENKYLNDFAVMEEAVAEVLVPVDETKLCWPDKLPAVVLKNFSKEITKTIFGLLKNFRPLETNPSARKEEQLAHFSEK